MKIEYEIDDSEIIEIAKSIAAERVADKLFNGRASYDRNVLVRAYKEICREIIYAHKEEIIDRVVIQATAEVKKKAIQKLLND